MSILLYVSLRKTVVTVGDRGLHGLRRQFKTSGFFCRIKFINHPSVKYIQDVRRIRPFSFYLNGVSLRDFPLISDKRGRSCQMAG